MVAAAAALMYERGVNAVSIDDIAVASGTGKGQFYHYFATKEELVAEVLRHQLEQVLEEQSVFRLDTLDDIRAWLEALVGMHESRRRFRGCPLGSIASEVIDSDPLRARAAEAFSRWESSLANGLRTMLAGGLLRPGADPEALAGATIAVLQGGYLLSSIKRDVHPMRNAVSAAVSHLNSFAS